jgi:hypothetical protein
MFSTSHTKTRPTRTFGFGDDRYTVRTRRPGRGNDRRAAIREQLAVAR